MEKTVWLTRPDNVDIHLKKWVPSETPPEVVVQLAHGMVEHIGRYDHFARFLLENNIAVYGNDHRGHGKTGEKQGMLGYFADENGFEKVAGDMLAITEQIKKTIRVYQSFYLAIVWGLFLPDITFKSIVI
ncbi:MAG TPA: alpha/beta hydrolase [Lentibacillus sp.]|nr:alpha/beta hydrolase [Lentibacillus sp.]HLS07687.1 alpha/beta hydrolase [Lentibacillus sp.]